MPDVDGQPASRQPAHQPGLQHRGVRAEEILGQTNGISWPHAATRAGDYPVQAHLQQYSQISSVFDRPIANFNTKKFCLLLKLLDHGEKSGDVNMEYKNKSKLDPT